ncbi:MULTISPECIES: 30S ribosomal protein S14 [unclassified Hyphomonas]|jgi:small subunit ribosomal protein S14|uniref:SSU ribosomal protein S14p (S29e) @ SSU ribosomal protein S14p (S29e), zinc-independent n=1 Tax=hydrothermal vent metagenome TaxID=652676 RepID=A0A160U222_9ZZZZ|nr:MULTISPECIES: 30S ribosomal protein S14 [unclassified Hyphomonas]KCZ64317.1 30S ribosomal protein S14 [Hyphomonas sp. L-53-1-40]MAA81809.1 30S ribosomal protein S14 [Hyphomonas sp.]MAL43655.1 30S ribosomal protein S14 [Hyphomonas sp.]MBG67689.1 30S ribosomal protein S14 [Hyphomonas sp.]MBL4879275.1 30S ribosomal protein S14 [Hyphomonas sp.]|tara:strand:- start:805 stop:1110 length:306 start_codon:yes stop_codon:yes gene_type:complete|mmetsp:Transcript_10717/g.27819  ORF Transcript_10717/g.27819 Transcript_10717/m.27819 type:complete len:102 (+) Transcript_10717:1931-2236(+)
MAKKSAIEKNKKRQKLVEKYAAKRAELKAVAMNEDLSLEERFKARLKLAELPRNSAPNRVRNRCEVTGRPRGYYRKLKMSRIALRELGSNGQIPGLVKSSW